MSLEELSLTGILGQIRIERRKELWEITTEIQSPKIWMNLEKLVSRCPTSSQRSDYDSAESIADSDLEDGELRKMLASPLKIREREENSDSSRRPTASGKPEAVIIQKRGASAQRTQADHSRRESLMSSSSQEPRASGKPDVMFSSRSNEPGNQLESSMFKFANPSNLGRSLLARVLKIICSVRQDLNLRSKNIKSHLSINVSISFSNKLMLKEWIWMTPITDTLNLEEKNLAHKKNYL